MFNVLVCDDDVCITQQVCKLLTKIQNKHKLDFNIKSANSGDSVIEKQEVYDIAIIDIEMPGISGLKLAQMLRNINPDVIIIILTSFSAYLDSAMDMMVFRYLSKPIDAERFGRSILDAVKRYTQLSKQIVLDLHGMIFTVRTKDILYIEKLKYGSVIVTKSGDRHKTNKKLSEWAEQIDMPRCFVYSHNSFLVNLQNVATFSKNAVVFRGNNGSVRLACVSLRKYPNLKKAFFSFAGDLK